MASGTVSPVKARLPERLSKRMQPKAQMSVRRSVSLPRACSGLMNSGVPTISPGRESDMTIVGDFDMSPEKGSSIALARPKSRTLTLPLGRELDVRGLQVPVDHALLVRHLERLGDLRCDAQPVLQIERTRGQALGERLALDELHHDVARLAVLLRPVDRRDGRVVDGRQHPGLAFEARDAGGVLRELVRQHLDRHVAAELAVARAIDLAHAADAEQVGDLVGAEAGAGRESH